MPAFIPDTNARFELHPGSGGASALNLSGPDAGLDKAPAEIMAEVTSGLVVAAGASRGNG